MAHKIRAVLVLGLLVAAAAHCAAHELTDRRLITFNTTPAVIVNVNDNKDLNNVVLGSKDEKEVAKIKPNGVTPVVSEINAPPTTAGAVSTLNETVSVTTEAPMTTEKLPTGSVSTEIPVEVPVSLSTTDVPVGEDSGQKDRVTPTIQGSYDVPEMPVTNIEADVPVTAESVTDALIIAPEEATVIPLITPAAPAEEFGSVDSLSSTTSEGKTDEPTTLPASIDSSSNNDKVPVSSVNGNEVTDGGTIPGQVHPSSSADGHLNGASKIADTKSSDSSRFEGAQMEKEASTGTEDYGAPCTTNCAKDDSKEKPSSDLTPSSNGGSSGPRRGLVNPGRVTDVNTSSAVYYNVDTGSIVAIVGVITGIVGLLAVFAAISRKKDTDKDDESPLRDGYTMKIHSVVRHSPTFLENDLFMESGNNGTTLTVAALSHQFDGVSSISNESSDEVPSLRGPMLVADHSGDISGLGCASSTYSFDGNKETRNVRMSSLFSAGSSMTTDSEVSCSWSSVLASDTENYNSRNTRDTSLSAWSATNFSPFGSTASSVPGMHGMSRSSSIEYRPTDGSGSSNFSSRLINYSNLPDGSRVAAGPVESSRSVESTEM